MPRIKAACPLAILLLLTACIDASAPIESRYGRYALHRVNGNELPQQLVENAVSRIEFMGGAVRLNADGSFTDSTDLRITSFQGGTFVRLSTDVAAGTYRISGDSVYYSSSRGEFYQMTFQSQTTLRQDFNGTILIYRR